MSAYRNIAVNAQINGLGDVNLRADNTGTGIGTVTFGNNGSVVNAATVSIFFNPSVNPAGSGVNSTSYTNSTENFRNNVSSAILRTYMLVNTVYDLQNIQNEPTLFGSGQQASLYALGRNIDASATATWNNGAGFIPIGTTPVDVIFNGQGHTIDRLTIVSSQSLVGLFGSASFPSFHNDGISNLGLTNVNITATAANSTVGALVGSNRGIITNVYVTGNVTASGTESVVGGLAGSNSQDATITGSYSNVSVGGGNASHVGAAGFPFSFTSPAPTGAVGGLIGSNIGLVVDSYSTGQVSGGSTNNIGGLIGFNAGTALRTYATGSVSGGTGSAVGGLVGYNDAFHGISFGGTTGIFEGDVQQSFASGSVSTGLGGYAGGLVGINHGIICNNCFFPVVVGYIDQSYSTSSVSGGSNSLIGGLVGWNEGTVLESYATGLITGDLSTVRGGLVGQDNHQTFGGTLSNNYWDIQTSGLTTDGASAGSTGLQTTDLKAALPTGFDPTVWMLSSSLNSGYPYLVSNPPPALTPPTPPTPPTPTPTPTPPTTSLPPDTFSTQQVANLAQPINTIMAGSTLNVTVGTSALSPQIRAELAQILSNLPNIGNVTSYTLLTLIENAIDSALQHTFLSPTQMQAVAGLFLTNLKSQNTLTRGTGIDFIESVLTDALTKALGAEMKSAGYSEYVIQPMVFITTLAMNNFFAVTDPTNAKYGGPQGAALYATIKTTAGELVQVGQAGIGLWSDINSLRANFSQLNASADQVHALALLQRNQGNIAESTRLLKLERDTRTTIDNLRRLYTVSGVSILDSSGGSNFLSIFVQ